MVAVAPAALTNEHIAEIEKRLKYDNLRDRLLLLQEVYRLRHAVGECECKVYGSGVDEGGNRCNEQVCTYKVQMQGRAHWTREHPDHPEVDGRKH